MAAGRGGLSRRRRQPPLRSRPLSAPERAEGARRGAADAPTQRQRSGCRSAPQPAARYTAENRAGAAEGGGLESGAGGGPYLRVVRFMAGSRWLRSSARLGSAAGRQSTLAPPDPPRPPRQNTRRLSSSPPLYH